MIVNNRMAEYIYSILLLQPTILMSWGFQSPMVIQNGLSFLVSGFKHKGIVSIKFNDGQDLFDIHFADSNDENIDTINMVYFDQLVEVIDERVEKTDDYNERINKEYNIK
ncbi:MAG: hypothetical protein ACOYO1_18725 [Bacteroidales bacterium]